MSDDTMTSNVLNDLRQFPWFNNNHLYFYGNPVQSVSIHHQAPYRQAQSNEDMESYK